MFLFYSIHYPQPGKEDLLVQSMHQFGELMKTQPGLIFVAPFPFKNVEEGTIMGISIWNSQEAFFAAIPILQDARKDSPSYEWEVKPPETYMLNSAL